MLELAGTISLYGIITMLLYGGYEYSKIAWKHISHTRYVAKLNKQIDAQTIKNFREGKPLFPDVDLIYLGNSGLHEVKIYYTEKEDKIYYVGSGGMWDKGYNVESLHRKTYGREVKYEIVSPEYIKSDERIILGYNYESKSLNQLDDWKVKDLKQNANYIFNKIRS